MVDKSHHIKLYIAEEQQLLKEAYEAFFSSSHEIEVVGASSDTATDPLVTAAQALQPNVMLLGFKTLQPATVEKLRMVRESCPHVAMVVLSAYYDTKGIKALREFARDARVGCAYLLKHTIDTVEQLTQVIQSVADGRIILDAMVMEGLINASESKAAFLKELTPREMEVLSWMAKGYRNNVIAEVLCLEPKTVERHINSIYSKLDTQPDLLHARVHAVMLYLKATGLLPAEGFASN